MATLLHVNWPLCAELLNLTQTSQLTLVRCLSQLCGPAPRRTHLSSPLLNSTHWINDAAAHSTEEPEGPAIGTEYHWFLNKTPGFTLRRAVLCGAERRATVIKHTQKETFILGVMNCEIKITLIFWYLRGHCALKTSCKLQNSKLSHKSLRKSVGHVPMQALWLVARLVH